MPTKYTEVRRRHRAIDIERDLHALWQSERFDSEAAVGEALRVYELAIRVEGWPRVVSWASAALAQGQILNAQLVELAMRALEQPDEVFFQTITEHLLKTAPANYFQFWHALFCAKHSHRGERLFRSQLASISDYQVVKYRRWLKRIFRKLRFRCKTDREQAIGAIAFAMYAKYDSERYPSQVFDIYLKAHRAAHTPPTTKQAKPVARPRRAEVFAAAASPLRMWSIAEGIRTSAKIPRTLGYLNQMAPSMSDLELLRALKAFDAKLLTADHKKASDLVTSTAQHISARLSEMSLPIEEWAKILPYPKSPVLQRLLEDIVGRRLDAGVKRLSEVPFCAIPIVDQGLDARAFRSAFLLGYLLHRRQRSAIQYLVGLDHSVTSLAWPGGLWPYGVGFSPPTERYEAEPDHPHRLGFELIRDWFPRVARQAESGQRSLSPTIAALRGHLYRRALVERQASALDVPVLFLCSAPREQERAALAAHLHHFAAAILVLHEQAWHEPLAADHVVHLNLSRSADAAIDEFSECVAQVERRRQTFDARRADVDRALRELLLGPPPTLRHVQRQPRT